MFDSEDTDDEEIENDDDLIESKLIGKALFCVHLNPKKIKNLLNVLLENQFRK